MNTFQYPFSGKTPELIKEVLVENDGTIVYPTETFYALGCAANNSVAVNKVYQLKNRSRTMPLLVLVDDWEMLYQYTGPIHPAHLEILRRHWPGPLTAILPHKGGLAKELNMNSEFLGFRMTSSEIAKELIRLVGMPLVGTSANISSQKETNEIETAQKTFGDSVEIFVDGGKTPGIKPSTLVDMTKETYKVVREGMISI